MKLRLVIAGLAIAAASALAACGDRGERGGLTGTEKRIANADAEPGSWLSHGRDYHEQRFSPLTQISTGNVGQLGLAWSYDIDEQEPVETTPLVVDGVLYATTGFSKAFALDAKTGKEIWRYDPQVDRARLALTCCNAVNRGLAWSNGKVYLGALDGRLIALDAKTGKPVWSTQTIDPAKPYTITGAPRAARGKVFIGNGGADLGVRGYVSAYDAETGKLAWRFYTAPGNPADGFEDKTQQMAAKTWKGEWWKYGGGATVWDSIVYDPELDLLYVGAGNGSPWNHKIRSQGVGDNLFVASIVALKPETGEYVWHYQVNPGESWDFSASMPMVLATLTIDGKPRKVLMQAPKNGFFYVIDRTTGKLISARPHVPVNWASGIDLATGRPIENPQGRYPGGVPVMVRPSAVGAGNWEPMSFSPKTGLVYMQSRDTSSVYVDEPNFQMRQLAMNTGIPRAREDNPELDRRWPAEAPRFDSSLVAWDPVRQQEVWRIKLPRSRGSGVLSTAGGLVFQGKADGTLKAYDAANGREAWSYDVQNIPAAAPIAFSIGADQYIAVATGWGYSTLAKGSVPHPALGPNTNRVLVFKLNGTATLPAIEPPEPLRAPPRERVSEALAAQGRPLYTAYCAGCHGGKAQGNKMRPDLRYSDYLDNGAWETVVLGGALKARGMASFAPVLTPAQANAVRGYVIRQAQAGGPAGQVTAPHQ